MTAKRKRPNSQQEARLIHIRLKAETHKRLRVRVAEEDVSIQDWVEMLIETGFAAPKSETDGRTARG